MNDCPSSLSSVIKTHFFNSEHPHGNGTAGLEASTSAGDDVMRSEGRGVTDEGRNGELDEEDEM